MPNWNSLQGRTILIVQRTWLIARALADAFEKKGAQIVMAKKADPDLANLPNLSAAVLDGQSGDLRPELQAKGIPFVSYTASEQTNDASVIGKPVPAADVVARVEEWRHEAAVAMVRRRRPSVPQDGRAKVSSQDQRRA